jgi:hypothetical protein
MTTQEKDTIKNYLGKLFSGTGRIKIDWHVDEVGLKWEDDLTVKDLKYIRKQVKDKNIKNDDESLGSFQKLFLDISDILTAIRKDKIDNLLNE